MVPAALLCTIALFVMQTLSMKVQHADTLPRKLLVNCAAAALAALGPSPRTPDQVAAATGLPMPRVQTALFELELTGAAAAQPGHTYIAVR